MRKNYALLWVGMICGIIGLSAWIYQSLTGFVGANMRNSFPWGLSVAAFEFFAGAAAGAMLIYALSWLFTNRVLQPVTRVAAFTSFACTIAAGIAIITDLGSLSAISRLFLSPNLRSPLIWDMLVMTVFLVVTVLVVLPQLRPKAQNPSHGLVMTTLIMSAVLGFVTALLFFTQNAYPAWNTISFPFDALIMGYAVGAAMVALFTIWTGDRNRLGEKKQALGVTARIAALCLIGHFFLIATELIPMLISSSAEKQRLAELTFGHYGGLYVLEGVLLILALLMFLMKRFTQHYRPLQLASLLVIVGVFVHKLMILLPVFNAIPLTLEVDGAGLWSMLVATGTFTPGASTFVTFWEYLPSIEEWGVFLLPLGAVFLIIAWLNNRAVSVNRK